MVNDDSVIRDLPSLSCFFTLCKDVSGDGISRLGFRWVPGVSVGSNPQEGDRLVTT